MGARAGAHLRACGQQSQLQHHDTRFDPAAPHGSKSEEKKGHTQRSPPTLPVPYHVGICRRARQCQNHISRARSHCPARTHQRTTATTYSLLCDRGNGEQCVATIANARPPAPARGPLEKGPSSAKRLLRLAPRSLAQPRRHPPHQGCCPARRSRSRGGTPSDEEKKKERERCTGRPGSTATHHRLHKVRDPLT